MNAHPALRAALVSAAAVALLVEASCARGVDDEQFQPALLDPDAGVVTQNLCVETQCPAPYATCPGVPGPCTVDLRSNVEHCGACGAACPEPTRSTHGSYVCSGGQCRLACAPLYADCNNSPADGCETSTESDPANCGFCGNACDEGVVCWKGACGCPKGFTQCGKDCKRLDSDVDNCSACGMLCRAPSDDADPRWTCGPGVTPANTDWTCASASCNLLCKTGYGDCNDDFCGDGCETDLLYDPANCGACGNKCNDGQWCNRGTCACPSGMTSCNGECVDLRSDPRNCGGCGHRCPGPAAWRPGMKSTGSPACEDGQCTYVCFPGFADCDGRISNGCEANLATDQRHCGDCATSCDVGAGQPCVAGACLTKPCERGPVR